jgi:site-specific DNA-methyltransferase (adenine-specific)
MPSPSLAPKIVHGDCLEIMQMLPDNSVDSIVTDPPYGLGFMGKAWDALPPGEDWARECLRVLKPGGHLLAFGGTRTWHRLAVAVEDAGFEIRDSIAWMYGSGFPKHRAALKPAFEPVVMARKPYKGSLTANEAERGTGALNIDGCRIGTTDTLGRVNNDRIPESASSFLISGGRGGTFNASDLKGGRWPANVVLDDTTAELLDRQSGTKTGSGQVKKSGIRAIREAEVYGQPNSTRNSPDDYGDSGGASRFFYVAKAPKRERPVVDGVAHPTVKPLALMRWLVRLVTPPGGTVLEPFAGSGATVEACILEGFHCIAIEREAEYLPLIQARIERQDAA